MRELFTITITVARVLASTRAWALIMTVGVSVVVVSGCTADTGEVRGAPEVGDPMPESVFANVSDAEEIGAGPENYEFLYRLGDDSAEYYRGPDNFDMRTLGGSSSDSACLSTVELPSERVQRNCTSAGDATGGVSYVNGELTGGARLSQTPPEDDLPWSNPVEGFWVIDLTDEE